MIGYPEWMNRRVIFPLTLPEEGLDLIRCLLVQLTDDGFSSYPIRLYKESIDQLLPLFDVVLVACPDADCGGGTKVDEVDLLDLVAGHDALCLSQGDVQKGDWI